MSSDLCHSGENIFINLNGIFNSQVDSNSKCFQKVPTNSAEFKIYPSFPFELGDTFRVKLKLQGVKLSHIFFCLAPFPMKYVQFMVALRSMSDQFQDGLKFKIYGIAILKILMQYGQKSNVPMLSNS